MPADVMSPATQRLSRPPVSLHLLTLAATLVALPGCGDSGDNLPAVTMPKLEVGELMTAREMHRLTIKQPLYETRTLRPAESTTSTNFVEPHHEPALLAPEVSNETSAPMLMFVPPQLSTTPTDVSSIDERTGSADAEETLAGGDSADGDWADEWADWPEDHADPLDDELSFDSLPQSNPASITPPAPAVSFVEELPPAPVERSRSNEPLRPNFFPAPIPLQVAGGQLLSAGTATTSQQGEIETEWFADGLSVDVPAAEEIGRLMTKPIREGFALGRSGAVFAARARFEETLRHIATAKDAAIADNKHTRALADGLLALDEAQHFLPQGNDPIDVAAVARGHRTPVLVGDRYERTLPQQAIARYHLHAAKRLADAVSGEQAGSMALFGLGKAYMRLAELSDDPLARRHGLTMYRAAILAHGDNYLAANELGVGLAAAGHFRAARRALERAAARGGGSTVYRNLAMVHSRLAEPQLALSAKQQAERIAAHERQTGAISKQLGVQWVSPDQFARTGGGSPRTALAKRPRNAQRSASIPHVGAKQALPVKSQTILR